MPLLYLIIIVLAKDLGATDAQIGFMFSIAAVGGIVGSILGGQIQKRFSFGQVIIAVGWIAAVTFMPFIWLLLTSSSSVWSPRSATWWVRFTTWCSSAIALPLSPTGSREVNSTFRLLAFGFQPLGSAIAGLLLKAIGTQSTLIFYLAVMLFLAFVTTINNYVRKARPIDEVKMAST